MTERAFRLAPVQRLFHFRKRCAGLTLIELMVAMVLSLVLMAGVLTIFSGTKTSYRLQNGLATLQENGRYALHLMVRDIRSAGFGGCAGIETMAVNVIANSMPDGMSYFIAEEVLYGMNDVASANAYDAVPGTDVVRIRGSENNMIGRVSMTAPSEGTSTFNAIGAAEYFDTNDILMITDCTVADIFRATNVTESSGTTTISHGSAQNSDNGDFSQSYGIYSLVLAFRSSTYFVKDSGRTNETGDVIRALYRRDAAGNDSELVDGIEDMQANYGVDVDGNGLIDRFVDASIVDANGWWANVLAVEVALLVNSVNNAHNEAVPYTYVGLTSTPVDTSDFRLRQEMASTVTIRNRAN